jgi:hypothetical protein
MDATLPRVRPSAALISTCVVAAYVVLACLAFAPTAPFDGARLPNGPTGDPLQMVWFLAWTPSALLHGHNPFFTTAIDYPSGANLASNTSVPLLGLLAAPITYLFNPITTFNVLLRAALAGSAISMYFVLGRWCRSYSARVVGGLLFGFGPYLATHVHTEGHLNLVFLPVLPLLAWCVDAAFFSLRWRAVPLGVLIGVLATAQLLISPELLSDCALVAGAVVVILGIAHRDRATERLRRGATVVASTVVTFGTLAAWPIVELLAGRQHLAGSVASVAHLQRFRTDLLAPLLPTTRELIAPGLAVRAANVAAAPVVRAGGGAELGAYLGVPLVVVCVLVTFWLRRRGVVQAFALATAVAFVLSLGDRLTVDGHVTPLRLPELVLAHLPLLKNTVPARFAAIVALGATVLVAIGLDRALAAVRAAPPGRRAVGIGATVVACGAVVLPLLPSGAYATERTAVAPSVATAISTHVPRGAVVLTYPYADPPFTEAMAWSALARVRFSLIGGYATVPLPSGSAAIFAPLLDPPSVQEFLAAGPVGRARHYPPSDAPSVADLCRFVSRYHVSAVVFEPVGPGATSVDRLFHAGFGSPRTVAGIELWGSGRRGRCRLP